MLLRMHIQRCKQYSGQRKKCFQYMQEETLIGCPSFVLPTPNAMKFQIVSRSFQTWLNVDLKSNFKKIGCGSSYSKPGQHFPVDMLWCNFILGWFNFFFGLFQTHYLTYHTPKQKKIKFKPRIKLNHNRYTIHFLKNCALGEGGYSLI